MELVFIDALPEGLDVQRAHPHQRNPWARDQTCFNRTRTKFVAAFNIHEHSMMNEMGQVVWGCLEDNAVQVQGHMQKHLAFCWDQPFAQWIDDDCFAIKIHGGNQHYPVVAVHFEKGFQVVGDTNNLESRASQIRKEKLSSIWFPSENKLLD